jgi:aminoglycoside phosphotransferase (APT) family kinase protein
MEEDSVTGQTTLLIDYVEDATRLDFAEPAALLDAARWIGEFHRLNEPRVTALAGCVYRYDSSYYLGWAQRALEFSRDANRPWLAALAARFETLAGELLSSSSTVIHGEYYPKNILVRGCEIAPIDWESAAIAAGEIDLASLVEGWDDGDTRACMTEYNRARWPHGAPAEFERRLAIAGMYWAFRWLGDPPEGTTGEDGEWLFKYLRELDEQLGGARE